MSNKKIKSTIIKKISKLENKKESEIEKNILFLSRFSQESLPYIAEYLLLNHLQDTEFENLKKLFGNTNVTKVYNKILAKLASNSNFNKYFKTLFFQFFPYPSKQVILKRQSLFKKIFALRSIKSKLNQALRDINKIFDEEAFKNIGFYYQIYFLQQESYRNSQYLSVEKNNDLENESDLENKIKNEITKIENLGKNYCINISCLPINKNELFQLENAIIISTETYLNNAYTTKELSLAIKGFSFYAKKKYYTKIFDLFTELKRTFSYDELEKLIQCIRQFFEYCEFNGLISNELDKQSMEKFFSLMEKIKQSWENTKLNHLKKLYEFLDNIEIISNEINSKIEELIEKKKIMVEAKELLNLLRDNDFSRLNSYFDNELQEIIANYEQQAQEIMDVLGINRYDLFLKEYPVKVDYNSVEQLKKELKFMEININMEFFIETGKIIEELERGLIKELSLHGIFSILIVLDFINSLFRSYYSNELVFPDIDDSSNMEFILEHSYNMFFNAMPITYGINTTKLNLSKENIIILTGANSGGKTTLLELILQSFLISYIGLPLQAKSAKVPIVEKIVYLKKFTGQANAGAFEQTIKQMIKLYDDEKQLLLIDEFESITEPEAAVQILMAFLSSLNQSTLAVVVTHLGKAMEEHLLKHKNIRMDGIDAKGLDKDNRIITDHQPKFYYHGKSTPELILLKLVNQEKIWNKKNLLLKQRFEQLINNLRKDQK